MSCPKCGDPNPQSTVIYIRPEGEPQKPSVCGRCAAKEKYEAAIKLKVVRQETIPLLVGTTTLVGTITWHEFSGPCVKCGHDHKANGHYRGSVSSGFICCQNNCGGSIPIVDPFPLDHGNCCSLTWPVDKIKQPDGSTRYVPTGPSYACRNMHSENVDEAAKRWPELAQGVLIEVLEDNTCRVIDQRLPAAWRKHYCSGCGYFEDEEAYQRSIAPAPPPEDQPRKLKTTWSSESKLDTGFIYVPFVADTPPVVDLKDFKLPADDRYKIKKINPDFFGKVTLQNLGGSEDDPRVCDGCGRFNEECSCG